VVGFFPRVAVRKRHPWQRQAKVAHQIKAAQKISWFLTPGTRSSRATKQWRGPELPPSRNRPLRCLDGVSLGVGINILQAPLFRRPEDQRIFFPGPSSRHTLSINRPTPWHLGARRLSRRVLAFLEGHDDRSQDWGSWAGATLQ